jgi:hypothetical protein
LEISFVITYSNTFPERQCKDGEVRLLNDGTPEFFWDKIWSPICGPWFWSNQNGANSFCQKLGYPTGKQSGRGTGQTYTTDAIRVGACNKGEILECCHGGCNDKGTGKGQCANCAAGQGVKITVSCEGHTDGTVSSSCAGNVNRTNYFFSLIFFILYNIGVFMHVFNV